MLLERAAQILLLLPSPESSPSFLTSLRSEILLTHWASDPVTSSEAFLDLLTQRKAFSILPCHRIISVPPGSVHFPFLAVKKAHSEWLQRVRARGTILQTLVV